MSEHINPKMGHLKRVHTVAKNRDDGNIRGAGCLTQAEDWAKVISQHPQACNTCLCDTFEFIWDSGASACITNNKNNFIGPIRMIKNGEANGISEPMGITGCGRVRWSLLGTAGNIRNVDLPCCCAPEATQRLLSTSVFCKECPNDKINLSPKSWTVDADTEKPKENAIDIEISQINNLPTSKCSNLESLSELAVNSSEHSTVAHTSNQNLDKSQKEVLRWHHRPGHGSPQDTQALLRMGALATTHAMRRLHACAANLRFGDLPKCASCLFGKQTNRAKPGE